MMLRSAGSFFLLRIALVVLAAALWSVAFGIFLWGYTPMLIRPRVDGKPG